MHPRASLLLVDDHHSIRDPLATYLKRYDFDVMAVPDGPAMRHALQQHGFDLIILDVMLPGEDGWSLCRFVHEHHQIPVILLTAMSEPADRIVGLELGADDFIAKPFDPRELVARVRSVLRRSAMTESLAQAHAQVQAHHTAPAHAGSAFAFEGWVFDTRLRRLRNPAHQDVALSTVEFHLLRVMVENPNTVLSRSRLLDLTRRDGDEQVYDRSIDSQVSRLRKKLQSEAAGGSFIKTARGDGYMFTADVQARA